MAKSAKNGAQKKFGAALRARRKAAKYTQLRLSQETSLDRAFISELERGLKEPGFHTLRSLGKALPGDMNELLDVPKK